MQVVLTCVKVSTARPISRNNVRLQKEKKASGAGGKDGIVFKPGKEFLTLWTTVFYEEVSPATMT